MIPLFKVFMSPEAKEASLEVLSSGYIGQGPKVDEFESQLSNFLNYKHLLTINSCTSALQLALHMVKEQDGDEVLTTPLTCLATPASIFNLKLKPKWVDIDKTTLNLDLNDLKLKLSEKTKIILIVHFGGFPIDYVKLNEILTEFKINYGFYPIIIEDCAHAFGSTYNKQFVGTFGNLSCFSFQSVKTLTTVDGGLLATPPNLFERAKSLRWFGLNRSYGTHNQDVREVGFKYNTNDIAAAIGIGNLSYIKTLLKIQRDNAAYYQSCLGEMCLPYPAYGQSSYFLFPILVSNRDKFEEKMKLQGVETGPVHYRNDKHHCFKLFSCELPQMDSLEKQITCLPCGWWVTAQHREHIVKAIKNV
jgi:dTDP-4-amino-4,6-dideoxygalactose transaminase